MVTSVLSGRETLGHLDGTLRDLQGQVDSLDRTLQALSGRMARSQLDQSEIFKRLAVLRLDAIQSHELESRLDAAERQVENLLSERSAAISRVQDAIAACEAQLDELEAQRQSLHDDVEEAGRLLAEREAMAQKSLEHDEAFQRQLETTRSSDAVAVSAAEKAEVALADRRAKGAPYESDPLFYYLWTRHFGTSEYRANPLTRTLDAWVARLCRYEPARQDYWLLTEIPKRLEAHAKEVRASADAELDKLRGLEAQAAAQGGVPAAKEAFVAAEQRQDEIDRSIAVHEAERLKLRAEQGLYSSGSDEYLAKCLATLEQAMRHGTMETLTSMARATMTLEDDDLVERLRNLQREELGLQEELGQQRQLYGEMLRRLRELVGVRNEFKQYRFDDLRSVFDNGDMLMLLMRQVLAGSLGSGKLWDALRRYQRYRDVAGAWPDFGSGGILNRRGAGRIGADNTPTWHWPGRHDGRGGFKLPRGPRRSGGRGGFRTGGGF